MLYLLTGNTQAGKTTWLEKLIMRAQEKDTPLDGIITPAVFEDGEKTAIDCLLLPQHESLRLAWQSSHFTNTEGVATTSLRMQWIFKDETIQAVNDHLAPITLSRPSEALLLIDELGWLEFNDGGGFTEAMRILDEGAYRDAIVVIRPALLEPAKKRWSSIAGSGNIEVIEPELALSALPFFT